MTTPVQKTDAEWKALLAEKGAEPAAFEVTRHAATERPFTRDELSPERHRRAVLSAAQELGARLRALDRVCGALTLTVVTIVPEEPAAT